MSDKDFTLGQRVRFTGVVQKAHAVGSDEASTHYIELPPPWIFPGGQQPQFQAEEGIITGRRFVADFQHIPHKGHWNEGGDRWVRVPDTTRRVWLISYDIARKPVMVYDHQVEAL